MVGYPSPAREWSLERKLDAIKAAQNEVEMQLAEAMRKEKAVEKILTKWGLEEYKLAPVINGSGSQTGGNEELGPEHWVEVLGCDLERSFLRARGIAVIADDAPLKELKELHAAGVRGIRLNLTNAGINDPAVARDRFTRMAARMKELGWHVQMFTSLAIIEKLGDAVATSPVPVVFDHFGGAQAARGVDQPGFATLVDLVKRGHAWVKISGAYRASTQAPDYPDVLPFARRLIEANADRIVWGTDWPHPDSSGARPFDQVSAPVPVDDARLLAQLEHWAPDAAVRKKILADNPARLYQF